MSFRVVGQLIVFAVTGVPSVAYCQAQTEARAFEVASVKLSPGPAGRDSYPRAVTIPDPGRVSGRNACLRLLIEFAYNLRDFQVSGPEWLDSVRYDIEAKSETARSSDELRVLLQELLSDRFHLVLHRETRGVPVLEMTVARGGPKMPLAEEGEKPAKKGPHLGHFIIGTTQTFAEVLSHFPGIDAPVVDKTGLSATYRFVFDLLPGQDAVPYLEENLGLKLTLKKSPADVWVVDHAEKSPREN